MLLNIQYNSDEYGIFQVLVYTYKHTFRYLNTIPFYNTRRESTTQRLVVDVVVYITQQPRKVSLLDQFLQSVHPKVFKTF